jgi:hypothetical protein
MPAAAAVEELAPAGAEPRKYMLEIGRAGRGRAERGRVERPASQPEQTKREQPAADLEAPRRDVLVRYAVTREVQRRTECQGREPRVRQRAQRSPRRNMKRDDQGPEVYMLRLGRAARSLESPPRGR